MQDGGLGQITNPCYYVLSSAPVQQIYKAYLGEILLLGQIQLHVQGGSSGRYRPEISIMFFRGSWGKINSPVSNLAAKGIKKAANQEA